MISDTKKTLKVSCLDRSSVTGGRGGRDTRRPTQSENFKLFGKLASPPPCHDARPTVSLAVNGSDPVPSESEIMECQAAECSAASGTPAGMPLSAAGTLTGIISVVRTLREAASGGCSWRVTNAPPRLFESGTHARRGKKAGKRPGREGRECLTEESLG
eukprot:708036-Hanusia_phi.AAC.1